MGGGPESRCVGPVCGSDGAVRLSRHHLNRTQDTSRALDDGPMRPKYVELRVHQ